MITSAALAQVLKTQYLPLLQDMFKRENRLFDLLGGRQKSGRIDGAGIYIPYQSSRNPTGGPGSPTGPYGLTGAPTWDHFSPTSTWYRNQLAITLESQDDSKQGDASYVQGLEQALKDCMDGFKTQLGHDMYGNRDGAIAVISADSAGAATLGVRNGYVASVKDELGSRSAMLRQPVNIIRQTAGPTYGDRCTCAATGGDDVFLISAIPNTQQLTFTDVAGNAALFAGGAPAEVTNGDIVVRDKGYNSTADIGYAIYGLDEIIEDGSGIRAALFADFGGIDRSAHPELDSTVITKGGVAMAFADLDDAFFQSKHRCGMDPSPGDWLLMCHDSVLNAIKDAGSSQIVYTPKTAPLGIDRKYLSYNPGIGDFAFSTDRMCPPRTLYGVHLPSIEIYENIPVAFDDSDGGVLKMYHDANGYYDIHVGFARTRLQMFSPFPHRHFKITNIGNTRPEFGANPASFVFPPA